MGEDIDVLYDFIHSGNPEKREHCNCEVRDKEMALGQDRLSGDYNAFWAGRDYMNDLGPLKCAVLMAHAFNDWNVMPEHSVRIYEALKKRGDVPVQCFFHQGGHGGPPPTSQMNRWFTRYLFGVENDVESDPKAWIVRESDNRSKPTAYADYPNPKAKPVMLNFTQGGNAVGGLSLVKKAAQGTEKLVDDVSKNGMALASMEKSENRLLFATPELTDAVHLSGTSTFKIRMASSKPAANLSVWMVSLPIKKGGKITDNIITRGWADPQNHESLTKSAPLEPGKYYELSFELQPDDQVIPAGQKIGLMIFSSDRDFTLWPKPGTELTVDVDNTSVAIPVVGGKDALEKAFKK